jgi:hypothetical protein
MELLPVLQAISTQHDCIELLRGHPHIPASQLLKYDSILSVVEATVEDTVKTPPPRSATAIKHIMASVIRNIAFTERCIAEHDPELRHLSETLRLRMAETCLAALQFELQVLTDALPAATDDGNDWIN